MKKSLLAIAVMSFLALGSTGLMAWGGGPGWCNGPGFNQGYGPKSGSIRGYGHLEFLKERIGLSDEQVRQIIKIDSEYRVKYYDNRGNYDKLGSLRTEHRKAVESALTPEQKSKLDGYYSNWRGPGYGGYGYCPWWK